MTPPVFSAPPNPMTSRINVIPSETIAIAEKIADNHPRTSPPVSSVRQNKKLLTVGN